MAESFGDSFSIVELTPDDTLAEEPATEIWIALAKPSQALTDTLLERHQRFDGDLALNHAARSHPLVLAAVPEGWTAELLNMQLTEKQRRTFEEFNLKPGDVYKISSK
ncbi:hypothetical protein AC629_01990 [Bradyrhizobium sp. NAS80.1]|uniref:hypothetical protein n=1 Tax=Bradyrhizobium sp. NAS80.1 TaxID=1680159 RepID=UPI00095B5E43|nr:hypothetical protein [Bradyrhizobium sp. NAS80.1]OKO91737.1 hypothetical protein AC629_01990 [Bradyrhizobium sp. NAS80.1]